MSPCLLLAPCTRARCQSRLSSEAISRLTVRHAYLKIRDGHTTTQQHETHKMSRCILFGHDHQIDTLFLAVMPRSHHGINGGWLPCVCVHATIVLPFQAVHLSGLSDSSRGAGTTGSI